MYVDSKMRSGEYSYCFNQSAKAGKITLISLDEKIQMADGFANRLNDVIIHCNQISLCNKKWQNPVIILETAVRNEIVNISDIIGNEKLLNNLKAWFIQLCHQNQIYGFFSHTSNFYFNRVDILPDASTDFQNNSIGFFDYYQSFSNLYNKRGIRYIDLIEGVCKMFNIDKKDFKKIRNKIGRTFDLSNSPVIYNLDKYWDFDKNDYIDFIYHRFYNPKYGTVI